MNKVPDGTSGRVLSKRDTENDAGDHQNIAVQNKISIFYRFLIYFHWKIHSISANEFHLISMKINKNQFLVERKNKVESVELECD